MGGSACQVIITEGNNAYAATEIFAKRFPEIETAFLESAIQASCSGILHASLYFTMEEAYHMLNEEYTQPIINLHNKIVNELPSFMGDKLEGKKLIDKLSTRLMEAVRKLTPLFEEDLTEIREQREMRKGK